MGIQNNTAYEIKLQALRQSYGERLDREGSELTLLRARIDAGTGGADDLKQIQRLAHGLAGTGRSSVTRTSPLPPRRWITLPVICWRSMKIPCPPANCASWAG
ncbi:MAG: hypothetical protein JWO78_842 [Micavibrio sp.]|nr:hypothetical protein [Micavibrio sp.]